ncbi:MAG TPA: hypothetical protein VHU84_01255 [Lacipirellulaceae bacterium]|nr:hypothetical protein [Lacipirellulaceae bacterium]
MKPIFFDTRLRLAATSPPALRPPGARRSRHIDFLRPKQHCMPEHTIANEAAASAAPEAAAAADDAVPFL